MNTERNQMIENTQRVTSNRLWKTAGALAIGLAFFASANVEAQVTQSITKEGAVTSVTTPKASTEIPSAQPPVEEALPANASVIYSNFGTGSSLYNPSTGWTEAGATANDYPIAEAMSFVPASDFIVLRIDGAFTYVTGTNAMHLVLAADNSGVPGKVIYDATFTNLPTFGTCCVVQTAKLTPTKTSYVALKGGATYWIYPVPTDATGYVVFNFDTTNQGGNGAVSKDYGKTWTTATLSPFGAFDLYGVKVP